MLNRVYKISFAFLAVAVPSITFAQYFNKTGGMLGDISAIVTNKLIPLVFALALLMFFWGIVKYIKSEGQGKEDGKRIMIWGIVALFVMSSVWGLVRFIQGELLGGSSVTNVPIPTIGN